MTWQVCAARGRLPCCSSVARLGRCCPPWRLGVRGAAERSASWPPQVVVVVLQSQHEGSCRSCRLGIRETVISLAGVPPARACPRRLCRLTSCASSPFRALSCLPATGQPGQPCCPETWRAAPTSCYEKKRPVGEAGGRNHLFSQPHPIVGLGRRDRNFLGTETDSERQERS